MTQIHPTALVDPAAELAEGVVVGAYSIIGPHVRVGAATEIGPHCVVEGHTTIGRSNRILQFASIGAPPQDKKYAGEPTRLEIGDGNTFREFVTILNLPAFTKHVEKITTGEGNQGILFRNGSRIIFAARDDSTAIW